MWLPTQHSLTHLKIILYAPPCLSPSAPWCLEWIRLSSLRVCDHRFQSSSQCRLNLSWTWKEEGRRYLYGWGWIMSWLGKKHICFKEWEKTNVFKMEPAERKELLSITVIGNMGIAVRTPWIGAHLLHPRGGRRVDELKLTHQLQHQWEALVGSGWWKHHLHWNTQHSVATKKIVQECAWLGELTDSREPCGRKLWFNDLGKRDSYRFLSRESLPK